MGWRIGGLVLILVCLLAFAGEPLTIVEEEPMIVIENGKVTMPLETYRAIMLRIMNVLKENAVLRQPKECT